MHADSPAVGGHGVHAAPTVSVIIIFLNEERFLDEAIASVTAQSFNDWELLLVDDGSTDGSTELARSHAHEQSDRVRYLEHDEHRNLGMSAARNLGLRHARGEFVAFLDGDDVWLPHKLHEQVTLMREHPEAAMVYGRTQYWHSWTGDPDDAQLDSLTEGGDHLGRVIDPPELLLRFLRNGDVYPCMCSILVRRAVAEEVGGFVEAFRDANEDMVFHTKIFLEKPVLVVDRVWDRYRVHQHSFWVDARRSGRMPFPQHTHPDHEQYLLWTEAELNRRGIRDAEIRRALDRALWPYRHPRMYRLRLAGRRLLLSTGQRLRRRLESSVPPSEVN